MSNETSNKTDFSPDQLSSENRKVFEDFYALTGKIQAEYVSSPVGVGWKKPSQFDVSTTQEIMNKIDSKFGTQLLTKKPEEIDAILIEELALSYKESPLDKALLNPFTKGLIGESIIVDGITSDRSYFFNTNIKGVMLHIERLNIMRRGHNATVVQSTLIGSSNPILKPKVTT